MLNNKINNINSSNNETKQQQQQQLSVKAYLMNKYENHKDPGLLNESQFNDFIMDNLATNRSSSSTAQQQATNNNNNNLITNIKSNKRHFSGGSTSSLQNSEDEDDDYEEGGTSQTTSREEKRRLSHTAAEQKRRNAIKHGYQLLQKLLPSQQSPFQTENLISTRTTRANTLEQTIDYIHQLEVDRSKHDEDVSSLKKEIVALQILKSNYEEILKCHRNTPKDNSVEINDETKFEIFMKLSDSLFQSFNSMTNTNSFGELSATMLNWVEQVCTSQNLKHIVILTLMQLHEMMN